MFLLWYCLVKHLDNIIQFLLKISLIWWINLFVISSIFLLMNHVLLKKIVIVVGKSTRSRVLRSGTGIRGAPKDKDRVRKFFSSWGAGQGGDGTRQNHVGRGWGKNFFPIMRGGRGWGKTKSCGARAEAPSFGPALPCLAPRLPSLPSMVLWMF